MNYMINELGIWEVAVLALLREGPMHPYQMQSLLRERHKDEILALKRGSLYHAIRRLVAAELIEAAETSRNGRRPERTTYRLTETGRNELLLVLQRMIAVPKRESSEFMTAMSFLVHLPPQEAILHLQERVRLLEQEVVRISTGLTAASPHVERIHLIESEYLLAVLRAESIWIESLIDDLKSGALDWNIRKFFKEPQAIAEPPAAL